MMQVKWIFQNDYKIDPVLDLDAMKSAGPFWGSWKTWRSCGTDNVICHDFVKARELINRNFQSQCNFYVPAKHYQALDRPAQVKLYDGDFDRDLDDIEDVIACHLASAQSEIILLIGFDFSESPLISDRLQNHKYQNRLNLLQSIMKSQSQVQWVIVDHFKPLETRFQNSPNITCDTMANVLQLLIQ